MFEKIITQIIVELGPSGLLIVGLYFSITIPLNKIVKILEPIKIETIPTKDVIIDCTEKICENINGKN